MRLADVNRMVMCRYCNGPSQLLLIIIRVFMKGKILSIETKCTHTHIPAHIHMSMLVMQSLIYTTENGKQTGIFLQCAALWSVILFFLFFFYSKEDEVGVLS